MRGSDGDLKRIFRKHLPRFDFQPVEMDVLAPGVPDLNYCCDGVEGFIELKQTSAWSVVVGENQVPWVERRLRAGGRVFVAVRRRCPSGPRRRAKDELWLLAGAAIRDLAEEGLRGVPAGRVLGRWTDGPARWDWPRVAQLLLA
jgi:hypothetical protein